MSCTVYLSFLAGFGFLLIGTRSLRGSLEATSRSWLASAVNLLTANPVTGAITSTVLTALIQSSSAVSVMAIGLADSGVISLHQALSIVLGANVGTTFTIQLLALNWWHFSSFVILAGLGLVLLGSPKIKMLGVALGSFGLILYGLDLMAQAALHISTLPWFQAYLTAAEESAWHAIAIGAIASALVQSSTVVTAAVVTLSTQALLSLPTAVSLVLGGNIGTCVTAVIASLGGGTKARQVALSHVLLNVLGVLALYPVLPAFVIFISNTANTLPHQVANAHTFFNLISSLAALPMVNGLSSLLHRLIPD
ncbi:MAG: Na/Pi cotransporter family protein [Clostridia bacterium]|nr:Na/Pi cotransporter family protein [Clostridia bacterium]